MKRSSAAILFSLAAILLTADFAAAQQVGPRSGPAAGPSDVTPEELRRLEAIEERIRRLEELYLGQGSGYAEGKAGAVPGTTARSEHVIDHGETLSGISQRYGVTVNELAQANAMSPFDPIYVGDRLVIPAAGSGASSAPAGKRPVSGANRPESGAATGWGGRYTVRQGDTLFSIATRHGVSSAELARGNGLADVNRINVGQVLMVPGSGDAAPVAGNGGSTPAAGTTASGAGDGVPETYHFYEVMMGDTLSGIAKTFFTTEAQLFELNEELREDGTIYSGQKIIVPTRRYFEELDRRESAT